MFAGTRRVALALAGFALLLAACAPATRAVAAPDMHTSRNSLDWDGVYEGVLPCPGCPEFGARVALNRDGTYTLTTWPLSRADPSVTARGKFSWLPAGNAITLDASGGERRWFVGEGRLLPAASDGTPDRSASAGALTQLSRGGGANVAETLGAYRWRLDARRMPQTGASTSCRRGPRIRPSSSFPTAGSRSTAVAIG